MSQAVAQFNALNGTVATREQLQSIYDICEQEEQYHLAERIEKALATQESKFEINIEENAFECVPKSMLNGLHFEENSDEENTGLNKGVSSTEIYQLITDKMLAMVKEASGKGYVKKWNGKTYGKGYTIPFNFESKKRYRGVNVFLLTTFEPLENPFFLTFKQIEANKGKLKKGSKGSPVVYFTKLHKITNKERNIDFGTYDLNKAKDFADKNGFSQTDIKTLPILKYYNVFNGKDIDGIDFDLENFKIGYIEKELPTTETMPIPEAIVNNYPAPAPVLKHGGNRAFYSPAKDIVQMPQIADFETLQDYYRVLFHEFSHSTGTNTRLNRDFSGRFGSKKYAFEELVAEWGATFLSAEAGIIWHTNNNHAEYLKNWNGVLTHLKDDNKFIMRACTEAQKLTDFVLQFNADGMPKYMETLKLEDSKIEVKKPAEKEAKKVVKPIVEPVENNYPFSKDDIPYETARRAYYWTSMTPEKRAEMEQKNYFETMQEVYDKYLPVATEKDLKEKFLNLFDKFNKGYLKLKLSELSARSNTASTMVTGGSNFNVSKNQKALNRHKAKLDELYSFSDKYQKYFKDLLFPETKPIKSGKEGSLQRLEEKLAKLEENQEKMVKANAEIRKLKKKGLSNSELIAEYEKYLASVGFSSNEIDSTVSISKRENNLIWLPFGTTNSSAEIRRLKQRIELEKKLKQKAETKGDSEKFNFKGGYIFNDYSENRLKIHFDEKPSEEVRSFLKKSGQNFKWSPFNKVWQRQLNTYYKLNKEDLFNFLKIEKEISKSEPTTTIEKHVDKNVATKKEPKATLVKGILDLDINKINVDENRFQNREKLNESKLKNIIDNFDSTQLDPLIIWKDPKNKKTYLLAGHHRLTALKRLGYKSVPVKYKVATEKEAIYFAKVESNANRSLETPQERAKIYREMRLQGDSKKAIQEQAKKLESNNANFVLNLSYLNPKGLVLQALNQLGESQDKQNATLVTKIADWIGEARKSNEKLTNSHEKEMFDFLQDKNASERIKTKSEFLQKIHSIAGGFDFEEESVLNLKRFKYKSEGESIYDSEYNDLKTKIDKIIENRLDLKDRISNPKNANYINPNAKDYEQVLSVFDKQTQKYTEELKSFQGKLIELQRNKGNYISSGTNQGALFGVKKPAPKKHAKIQKIGLAGNNQKSEFFTVAGEVGKFLQQVERKPFESVVITLDGEQGGGKTTTLYKFMDSFAVTGNKCLFLSLEEHPTSSLAKDKVSKYLSSKSQDNIDTVGEVENVQELYDFIADYDIVFIDSWQKLLRMVGAIRLDEDLRKKFNGKVFVVIFQQTTTGRTKGGAEVVFDGDIIIKMVKEKSFAENYAYFDKNRYTLIPTENIRYNIATGKVYNPNEETATVTEQEEMEIPTEEINLSFEIN